MVEEKTQKAEVNNAFPVIQAAIVILVILVIAGGFFWYQKTRTRQWSMQGYKTGMMRGGFRKRGFSGPVTLSVTQGPISGRGVMMQPQSTPDLTDLQKQELASGTATITTNKTFTIDGGNFYFVPNAMTVNKGDKVTFVFKNDGGIHNLMLGEFNVKTDTIQTGATQTVSFTADKVGSFQYYCSIGAHRKLGMWGILTVK